jgi:hypothetical protein
MWPHIYGHPVTTTRWIDVAIDHGVNVFVPVLMNRIDKISIILLLTCQRLLALINLLFLIVQCKKKYLNVSNKNCTGQIKSLILGH